MAGERCGFNCGYCGRCDAEPEAFCEYCERLGCPSDCPEYYDAMDTWAEEEAFESFRDGEPFDDERFFAEGE